MVLSKYELLTRDFFTCQNCKTFGDISILERAHMVKQGSPRAKNNGTINYIIEFIRVEYNDNITKSVAKRIMHDEKNVITSCKKCNSSFNIFNKPELRDKKIKDIYEKEFLSK